MSSDSITMIYVDMDGVIANFNKRYIDKFGVTPEETRHKKSFSENFKKFIDDREFANLELMPDAQLLFSFLNSRSNIPKEILSSTAREDSHVAISEQKHEWLKKHNINYKENFVPGKSLKAQYATPTSILIDDTLSVIDAWDKAGGIGILHKNAVSTLAILSMYV
jgi:hypothetical protein